MFCSQRLFISVHVGQLAMTHGSSRFLYNQLLSFLTVPVEQVDLFGSCSRAPWLYIWEEKLNKLLNSYWESCCVSHEEFLWKENTENNPADLFRGHVRYIRRPNYY